MKIAVTASGPTLDDQVDQRFGRCAYFLIVEIDTMEFEAVENPNTVLGGGAGIQSAQLMSERDAKTVLTGNCGPNAFQTLGAAGVQVIIGVSGVVREVVEQFKSGALSTASDPNVASHFGTGDGGAASSADNTQSVTQQMGTGGGIPSAGSGQVGGGRGMGMGRGMGRGVGMGNIAPSQAMTGGGDVENLKDQAQALEEQLKVLNARISQGAQGVAIPRLLAVVDLEKCNACGICEKVCPTAAITMNEAAQIDSVKCNGCGRCVAECPQDAISLRKAE